MKKLFNLAGLFLAITTSANAQIENVAPKEFVSTTDYSAKATANDHALRKFGKFFPNATDESWIKTKDGFTVRFTSNNILQLVFLTKHGNVISSIKYYTEKELPSDVRQMVRHEYPIYSIKSVQEVNASNKKAYLVTIEDATTWKIIRVVDDEMDVYGDYIKG